MILFADIIQIETPALVSATAVFVSAIGGFLYKSITLLIAYQQQKDERIYNTLEKFANLCERLGGVGAFHDNHLIVPSTIGK